MRTVLRRSTIPVLYSTNPLHSLAVSPGATFHSIDFDLSPLDDLFSVTQAKRMDDGKGVHIHIDEGFKVVLFKAQNAKLYVNRY
jgi:delta 1-pyrroline-5-carboxylate dehydrogenase